MKTGGTYAKEPESREKEIRDANRGLSPHSEVILVHCRRSLPQRATITPAIPKTPVTRGPLEKLILGKRGMTVRGEKKEGFSWTSTSLRRILEGDEQRRCSDIRDEKKIHPRR